MTEVGDWWLALGIAVFVLAVVGFTILARRDPKPAPSTDAKLDAIDRRLGVAEEKLRVADHDLRNIRAIVGNLPTKDSINAISLQIAESNGKIEGMQATQSAQSKTLDRIEDFLLRTAAEAIVSIKPQAGSNGDKA